MLKSGKRGAKGLAPKTVRNVHGMLHHAFADAVKWRRLAVNPCAAADQQYAELREDLQRIQLHFEAMLETRNTVEQKQDADPNGLKRYAEANSKLLPPDKAGRVVFLGDSITDGWGRRYGKFGSAAEQNSLQQTLLITRPIRNYYGVMEDQLI